MTNGTRTKNGGAFMLGPNGSGYVLVVNVEDDVARTLKLRLAAMHANMAMIFFITTRSTACDETGFSFFDKRDIERLAYRAKHEFNDNVGLIIVDPIYLAVDGDHNDNSKARQAYQNLTALAKRLGCSVAGVAHTGKNVRGKTPLDRVGGAPALREVPRAIILLNKITNGPTETGGTYVAVHAKNNNGSMNDGFEYRVVEAEIESPAGPTKTTKFEITRGLFGSAEDILREAESTSPVLTTRKLEVAIAFLKNLLEDGPMTKRDILQRALMEKISEGTLINAKTSLKIGTTKRKGDGLSMWSLPKP
jgi:RecA-family ATPase